MAFSVNSSQQISMFDATANLTQREIKMLDKSWAKYFAENIFPAIDEEPFRVLYSDRPSRVATIKLAKRTSYHAEQQRFFKTKKFSEYARFRNGVETIPAALRRRHNVDKMPARGLLRCRLYFWFKIAAMNVRKLVKYMSSLGKYAPPPEIA